ncbi:MAG TPA: tail fiber domain-containing protein [Methylomirabilota bacterium]|nr:tail fiber domain-containing protein [Methylomirabilota bacterium]
MNHLIQSKSFTTFVILAMTLVCSAFPQQAQAQAQTNTAYGSGALVNLTSGIWNSAFGFEALNHDTTGNQNTATGVRALFSDTGGGSNTATGVYALYGNTTGFFNNAVGAYSLANNTVGNQNTATGYKALYYNTQGGNNTATGFGALYHNTTGTYNTANGLQALYSNTTGNFNTAIGIQALLLNTTGHHNAAIGIQALDSNTSGSNNIALGHLAGENLTTGINNIDIGNGGVAGESGRIRIGTTGFQLATFIAGIRGVTTGNPNAVPVLIDSVGQLGTASSSRRFKKEIKSMDRASEAILALKPVTFHYKSDATGTPQFGLIAEEVAAVNPDLVVRDETGEIYTVRYDAVNAMLLNEFLKEHRTLQEQKAIVAQLKQDFQSRLAEQQKQIEALTASFQKVSAQLEASKPAPHVVNNP